MEQPNTDLTDALADVQEAEKMLAEAKERAGALLRAAAPADANAATQETIVGVAQALHDGIEMLVALGERSRASR